MKRRIAAIGILGAFLSVISVGMAFAAEVTVADLIESPTAYAGQTVTVQGELIGDYGFRGNGFMWTQLDDDRYAESPVVEGGPLTGGNLGIGIQMPADLGEGLSPPGGYRLAGPIVRVTGVFKYHSQDRQGETYLDVEALEVVTEGRRIEEHPLPFVVVLGALLVLVAFWLHWSHRSPAALP